MKKVASRTFKRVLIGAFAVSAAAGLFVVSARAQFFDERFPFERRGGGGIFSPFQPSQRPADNSHAPPPRKYEKNEAADLSTVMVMGDALADWLAYGLEAAYADSPDITVARKFRAGSSLIFNEPGKGPRSKQFDWAANAKETLAKESASVVVMMVGLADRMAIREPRPVTPPAGQKATPQQQRGKTDAAKAADPKTQAKPDDKSQADKTQADATKSEGPIDPPVADQTDDDPDLTIAAPEQRGAGSYEFKSDKWVEAYNKRLDEVIAALRSKNVPVIWVGLPPVRGPRAMSDMAYLNELYKARAEKAGITYVDVWDGFVDEGGRFNQIGPDSDGQIRRLRTADGVFFTQAGARKLALYVDKEIRRAMTPSGPIAIPLPVEPGNTQQGAATPAPDQSMPRPLAGPVIPLNASGSDMVSDSNELAGGSGPKQTVNDVVAARVLTKGEAAPVPAGRADDFVWPRRVPAPFDADPVVARTLIPMTPMLAERPGVTKEASAVPDKQKAKVVRTSAASREAREARAERRAQRETSTPFFFFFNAR